MVVDLHYLMAGIHFVQQQRQGWVVGVHARWVVDRRPIPIGLVETLLERNRIAHRRNAAANRALTYGNENVAIAAKLLQYVHVLFVAAAALDQTDRTTLLNVLDVVDGRAVELDQLDEIENLLIDVQDGHMAAEAAGQRNCRDPRFHVSHGHSLT